MSNEGVTHILSLDGDAAEAAAELERLRRNITVLFTDLKGSTAYFERFGDAAGLLMVHRCNSLLGQAVERHGGRVIKEIGDAVMAAFPDHAEAVAASIEMQEAITADNAPKPETHRVSVRIGINYGLGLVKSNDVYGDVVNVASRVESAAAPEQILISDNLYAALGNAHKFNIRYAGKFSLKGKSEDRDLYEVVWREAQPTPVASHSMFMPVPDFGALVSYKLVQVRTDGRPAREFAVRGNQAIIGRFQGDITFAHDEYLKSPHARTTVEAGQLFVEPAQEAAVFFSLVGPYRLEQGDIVKTGGQLFEFHVDAAAVAAAAVGGKSSQVPMAEFASLIEPGKRFPVSGSQITFGRTKGNYTFATDGAMSRSHARVYHRGEDFFIEDTGSTNGTFVMAKQKVPVPAGSMLGMGGQLLKVEQVVKQQ